MTTPSERAVPESTARLLFRTWRPVDLPLAVALWGDPRVTTLIGGPFDEEAVRQRLEREDANLREHRVRILNRRTGESLIVVPKTEIQSQLWRRAKIVLSIERIFREIRMRCSSSRARARKILREGSRLFICERSIGRKSV